MNNYIFSKKIKKLFPTNVGATNSSDLFKFGLKTLNKSCENQDSPWIKMKLSKKQEIIWNNLFSKIPENGVPSKKVINLFVKKLFDGVPNWRNPKLQYNICAPVNVTAGAVMSLAQELNVHNINNNFSGNCLLAENLVSNMMADLINLNRKKVKALFSFGGTASNLYAMKLAINKANPSAGKFGITKNTFVIITEGAHFSHKTAADWLGIGTNHLVILKADKNYKSMILDAEKKAEQIINNGGVIAGFLLNGGTLYDAAIDDIKGFVKLRKKLINKYKLNYSPHIHVDSVIGWVWLMFNNYNFKKNPLKINSIDLKTIQKQFKSSTQIRLADSWGVDFHKALGGCPTPSGLFVSNNINDLKLLSKSNREICETHHLGGYWSTNDPSDITLETSRSAGPALAALASLSSLGKNGFRCFLANQIMVSRIFKNEISKNSYFIVGNQNSLGFNVMLLISPKNLIKKNNTNLNFLNENENLLNNLNLELKEFYEWSLKNKDQSKILGCSFSKSFSKTKDGKNISGLKYCIVSPHTNPKIIKDEVKKLNILFSEFKKGKKNE